LGNEGKTFLLEVLDNKKFSLFAFLYAVIHSIKTDQFVSASALLAAGYSLKEN
jgi:hypothetical protein